MNTERFHTNCHCDTCIEHQSVDIEGYENYRIFKDGRVWSKNINNFKKSHIDKEGYDYIMIQDNKGKRKRTGVHRLVAIHYIPNPDNKPTIDHINRIRHDNRIENLRWATHKEQCNNRKIKKCNKSGHQNISITNSNKFCVDKKLDGKTIGFKEFKNKIDAICYKYILLLKIKSKYY